MNIQNSNEEKIYPINVSPPDSSSDKPQQDKKPTTVPFIIGFVLLALFAALAVMFAFMLFENRDYEYGGNGIPASAAVEIGTPRLESVDVSDIPQAYIDSLPVFNFMLSVPESEAVDNEYFADTVFIGDSRTQGLLMYTSLDPNYDFSAQGATTLSVRTKPYITLQDDEGERTAYTLKDALTAVEGNYKSIYISLGINELGWNKETFVESFRSLINTIREITDAPIYIQLILPVTTAYAENSKYGVTNDKQIEFNQSLIQLAAEMSVFYLDPTPHFTLEDGSLDPSFTFDGAHLTPRAYETIARYYRTHTVDISAYSNTCFDKAE